MDLRESLTPAECYVAPDAFHPGRKGDEDESVEIETLDKDPGVISDDGHVEDGVKQTTFNVLQKRSSKGQNKN